MYKATPEVDVDSCKGFQTNAALRTSHNDNEESSEWSYHNFLMRERDLIIGV